MTYLGCRSLLQRSVLPAVRIRLPSRVGFLQQARRYMMDDSYDEEEALKAALAASLQDSERTSTRSPTKAKDFVDLTTDSDDSPLPATKNAQRASPRDIDESELQRAIALSLGLQMSPTPRDSEIRNSKSRQTTVDSNTGSPTPVSSTESSPGLFSILGIDRKKQEEERLARLARKRKADDIASATESDRPAKAPKPVPVDLTREPEDLSHTRATKPAQNTFSSASSFSSLQFPRGAVKKTWALNCERENDIKFDEVVQKDELEFAVLSSFQWDYDWLFTKFDVKRTRFMLVMGHKEEIMVWNPRALFPHDDSD